MHHRGPAFLTLALAVLVPLAGCFSEGGRDGDPGAAFKGVGWVDGGGATPTGPTQGTSHGRDAAAGEAGASDGTASGDAGASDGAATDGAMHDASGETPLADAAPRALACTVGATSTFSLAWSLEDATGASSTCAGTGGVTVDVDAVNLATGAEAVATIPCGALAATTCAMPAGRYSISMKLRDAQGLALSEVFAPTLFLVEGQATGVTSLPLRIGGDATLGRGFALTWSIADLQTGAIQSCAQAGAVTVRLVAGTTKFDLTCGDGKGRTTTIPPGAYPVILQLLDATGAKLSETQTMSVAIAAGQLVFLGDVSFDVN